jgi:hypothetical protein
MRIAIVDASPKGFLQYSSHSQTISLHVRTTESLSESIRFMRTYLKSLSKICHDICKMRLPCPNVSRSDCILIRFAIILMASDKCNRTANKTSMANRWSRLRYHVVLSKYRDYWRLQLTIEFWPKRFVYLNLVDESFLFFVKFFETPRPDESEVSKAGRMTVKMIFASSVYA